MEKQTMEKQMMEKQTVEKKFNILDNFVIYVVVLYFMLIAGQLLGDFLMSLIRDGFVNLNPELRYDGSVTTFFSYAQTVGAWIVTLLILIIFKKNRYILSSLGIKTKGNNIKMLLVGLFLGFAMNGFCALTAYLNGDIDLTYSGFSPLPVILIFLAVFVQSSSEEIICRGYLYQKLLKKYNKPAVAIWGNALLFAALHFLNPGFTIWSMINITAVGVLFSLLVYYFDSIWCAFAVHAAWNFTQNIILGLPNSGNVMPYSIFKLEAGNARNSFFYNVGFGIEGSIIADIVIVLMCVVIYLIGKKKKEQK